MNAAINTVEELRQRVEHDLFSWAYVRGEPGELRAHPVTLPRLGERVTARGPVREYIRNIVRDLKADFLSNPQSLGYDFEDTKIHSFVTTYLYVPEVFR